MKDTRFKVFNYVKFAKQIINKRFDLEFEKQRHFGLRDLAKIIGVSSATLSRAMNGKKVDLETGILICRWIGKEINDFVIA